MIYIFTAGVLWGTIGLFVKELAASGAQAPLICIMRMLFAFIVMMIPAMLKNGRKVFQLDMYSLLPCLLLGVVSHGLFNICYTASIRINGMGIASVLLYTAPVFTALASRIIFHENLTARKLLALVLNVLGCILTVTGGRIDAAVMNLMGILAGLGSGFCYGMAAVFGRSAEGKVDPLTLSAYSYLIAVIFLLVFMRPDFSPALNSIRVVYLGFLYGLIPTAGAYLVYYIGLGRVHDLSRVPIFASIEPIIAVILGTYIYGERIGLMNYAGVAVVLISIIIMVKSE